jgi:hypothetical protein
VVNTFLLCWSRIENAFPEVFMIPVSSAVSSRLTWSNLSPNQGCELKSENQVTGTLRHPSWSSDYLAATTQGNWTFRRSGFWGTGTEIVDSASEQRIATFKSNWGGRGELRYSDGQRFHFQCKGLWHPVWTVTSEDGRSVFELHIRERYIEVPTARARSDSCLTLLVMFALYRVRQAEEDAASATIVAVIAAS